MQTSDVIIIGGGLMGLITAWNLARRGLSVRLLEKDSVGRHASGANAGGVRQIWRAPAEIPLSMAAMDIWYALPSLVGDDCGFTPGGHVFAAESQADMERLHARHSQLTGLGFRHEELIDGDELREFVPFIARHCVGGLVSRRDGSALPMQTVLAFRKDALALGVEIEEHATVTGLERKAGVWSVCLKDGAVHQAESVVNTAGAWGNCIAERLGEAVPLRAIAPMLMVTERLPPFLDPVVSVVSEPLSFKQGVNGTVIIGGGHEGYADPSHNLAELRLAGLSANAATVMRLFPRMRDIQVIRAWAAIEGRTSDDLPVIGPSGTEEGLFHAFGFSAHGFQLSPAVGEVLADLVTEGRSGLPIAAFAITRFETA